MAHVSEEARELSETPVAQIFAGPGEMRALCRRFDWAATPLGPVDTWSHSLRTIVATLLASRHPMFLFWGPDLVQLFNDAYRPSFGQGGRHLRALGARGAEFWTEIWDIIGPQIAQVMAGGEATWHEDHLVPIERNGRIEEVYWTYSYSPAFDDDGSIAGVLVVCQETTQSVRVAAALRESESKYRALFNSLDAGICVFEMIFDERGSPIDYRFVEVNPAFERQTGLVGAVGRTARELIPTLESHWFDIYGRVATTGEPVRFQNGSEPMGRWFDVFAFRIGAPEQRRVALLFNDVTAMHVADREREQLLAEAERARRAAESERSRTVSILEAMADSYALLDSEFRLISVNGAMERAVGMVRDKMLGRTLWELFPGTSGTDFERYYRKVATEQVEVHFRHTYADARLEIVVDVDAYPTDNGGIAIFWRDVTEGVRSEAERARLLAEAEAARADAEGANRAKSEFLAVMSHELRTPLNAIGGYAELMEMGIRGPVTPQQREDLTRIQTSQRHLLGLINEVLNYAKLETGSVQFDITDVRAREVLLAAELLVAPQARAKGLVLSVTDCAATLTVRADMEKLRQIVVNLASNAVKFTNAGGRIEMSAAEDSAGVSIWVRDSGIGIPADRLEAIFDPFVQVRSDLTRPHEGTGLGLAISRDLARGMGGDLTVQSTLGVGSTFTVLLPR